MVRPRQQLQSVSSQAADPVATGGSWGLLGRMSQPTPGVPSFPGASRVRCMPKLPRPFFGLRRRWSGNDISRRQPQRSLWSVPAVSQAASPSALGNNVAVVKIPNPQVDGGQTEAYILGISHVSAKSCDDIRDTIGRLKPDIVMIELCKDRTALLADKDIGTQTWHTRKISLFGSTFSDAWPSQKELLSLLNMRVGYPVSVSDIEDDVVTLLSTGLFRKGKPGFRPADLVEGPAFLLKPEGDAVPVQTIPALGEVQFAVEDRVLPPIREVDVRLDSSLKGVEVSEEALESLISKTLENDSDASSLEVYLQLRKDLLELLADSGLEDAVVVCRGEDRGKLGLVLRARRPDDRPLVTGLEDGAEGGSGWGIDRFQPAKKPIELSSGMSIPRAALERLLNPEGTDGAYEDGLDDTSEGLSVHAARTIWEAWEETRESSKDDKKSFKLIDSFGDWMTGIFSKYQGAAGRKVGIDPGAAWRASLDASAAVGVSQIHLVDCAEEVTSHSLATSLFKGMIWRLGLAGVLFGAVVTGLVNGLPEDIPGLDASLQGGLAPGFLAAGFVASGAILWPILGPIFEVYRLSQMSPEEIEDAVSVKEPIQSKVNEPLKLFGEDALIDWPGAEEPIIHKRDVHMAHNLRSASSGEGSSAPAYILDKVRGNWVYRLMMPKGGGPPHVEHGLGDGEYLPLENPKRVVAIVGTAHVRGICRTLENGVSDSE